MANTAFINGLAQDAKFVLSFAKKNIGVQATINIKITDHFTCTFANAIYCITCTYCKKIYIAETGRRVGDLEHICDVERNDKDASKPLARHFNLPNHSISNIWQSAVFPYI